MLQRQVSFICSLLYVLSACGNNNSHNQFNQHFHTGVLLAVIIVLVIIPLTVLAAVKMITDKERIKKIITIYCKPKPDDAKDNNEAPPINDIDIVIDDSMRKNATIVDM